MTRSLNEITKDIINFKKISFKEMKNVFSTIMDGNASDVEISSLLVSLNMRGETEEDIAAGASILREKSLKIDAPLNAIDIVGTGGDKLGTYNISTASAFVLAGCGIPVAKHGNKAVSSKSGAADVLTSLGVNINCKTNLLEKSIKEANIAFLMATRHHSAMKYVGPVRSKLGIRTIFNLLGPLSNPCLVKNIMIGVYDIQWLEPFAKALKKLGTENAWIVNGHNNLDELSTTGQNNVCSLSNGKINMFTLDPVELGFPKATVKDLKGKDPEFNANALISVLEGKDSHYKDIVLLNSSAALVATGNEEKIENALIRSEKSINEGKALMSLEKLINITNLD